jgi:hypothetical protein
MREPFRWGSLNVGSRKISMFRPEVAEDRYPARERDHQTTLQIRVRSGLPL